MSRPSGGSGVKRRAKKRPGRPSAAGGRVKFTTTLPPQTVADLDALARDAGHGSRAQVIVKLVQDKIDQEVMLRKLCRPWKSGHNQTGKLSHD